MISCPYFVKKTSIPTINCVNLIPKAAINAQNLPSHSPESRFFFSQPYSVVLTELKFLNKFGHPSRGFYIKKLNKMT